jgi:hypothetical protein
MRLLLKHYNYLFLTILLLSSTGCLGDIKNPIQEEDAFKLETFRWESIPQNIQDQVSGAGCTYFANNNNQDILLTNGLVKINGIFEIIEYKSSNDDYTNDIYENDRWIIYGKMVSNPDGTLTGTLKLRSKSKDGSTVVSANKVCGS